MFRRIILSSQQSSQHILNGQLFSSHFNSVKNRSKSSIKLSYNEFGTGESGSAPLVIMHGLFGSKQNWRSISKAIVSKSNPKRKVITLDARNHGESPHSEDHTYNSLAEDIRGVLHSMNIEKAIIMGHSMGGRAMMYFSLKYPEIVDRAIIVDISPMNTSRSFTQMGKVFSAMKSISVPPSLTMSAGRKKVKEHLLKSIEDSATVDFLILNLRKNNDKGFYWIANVDGLERHFPEICNFPKDELPSTRTYNGPVLFIGGSRSDFISQNDLPGIQRLFPKAKLKFLETGHLVQLEKPAEFILLVLDFINSK